MKDMMPRIILLAAICCMWLSIFLKKYEQSGEQPKDNRKLTFGELARIQKEKREGYSGCGRCGRTWSMVKSHVTLYDDGTQSKRGVFALCEKCWEELKTPDQRMPFYMSVVDEWKQFDTPENQAEDKREPIRKAVMEETQGGDKRQEIGRIHIQLKPTK